MAARTPKATKAKASKVPKPPKAPPPTPEAVAARLLGSLPVGEPPMLWKEADLKRRLTTAERPQFAAALAALREGRQALALAQGKSTLYLFAEPLREWLTEAGGAGKTAGGPPDVPPAGPEGLLGVYTRLVQGSGGFLDVKIAGLRAALGPAEGDALPARLVALWREGRATFSQGDWSLADEATRAAAVEVAGERYLLVRLEEAGG